MTYSKDIQIPSRVIQDINNIDLIMITYRPTNSPYRMLQLCILGYVKLKPKSSAGSTIKPLWDGRVSTSFLLSIPMNCSSTCKAIVFSVSTTASNNLFKKWARKSTVTNTIVTLFMRVTLRKRLNSAR